MDVNESHVQTLLGMGFPCERDIRRALLCSKNDLNDAVAILTEDHTGPSYDHLDQLQLGPTTAPSSSSVGRGRGTITTTDQSRLTTTTTGGGGGTLDFLKQNPSQRYDENVVDTEKGAGDESIDMVPPLIQSDDGTSYEFPVTNLYELEGRVFVEQWSIPYRKEESLGKCLLASTYLADAGLADSNEDCKRFLDRCMPEAFKKLMTFPAVHRWTSEIQEGIYNMLQLLIDLVVARLQHLPVPIKLLDVLSMAFDQDAEFHFKNRARQCDKSYWKEKFATGELYAISSSGPGKNDPYGWLTNLINRFAYKHGFEHIKKHLDREDLDAPSMAALLRPFGICADFLNPNVMLDILAPGLKKAIKYVQSLEEKDFKEKKVGSVSDLLASMKLLCMNMWPKDVEAVDALRLDVALRMLKSPHFNAKMNSLKEVSKLIDDATVSKLKTAIHSERILDFLVEKRVLAIALEGNIDQAQYCDKVKGIVDFLGAKISSDELSMIWKMQNGQSNNVIDNIHSIIAAAAVKFDAQQLEQLFFLIQKKWQDDNDRIREKLLSLIGKIGKDARVPKTTTRVLELLWDLSHLPALSTHLIEQALNEHLLILSDSYIVKEQVKRQYVMKCVEDIKKGAWVLPALKQLLHLCRNISKQSFNKSDKGILYELNKNQDVVKLVTSSLTKCHKMAAGVDGTLSPYTIVDGRYTHSEYVSTHLNFLQYILQVGIQCLTWNRAREIWSTLVANQEACDWDKETCYEWFSKGIGDLEAEAVSQLFQKELLKLDPSTLSEKGFACVKNFFETANLYEHKLKRSQTGPMWIVEKPDLCGLEFLWETCLNTPNETIAEAAIELLLDMSYSNLTSKMKKDPVNLHKKFITECYNRLEVSRIGIGGSVLGQVLSSATKILTAAIVPDVATGTLPSNCATKSESNLVVSESRRVTSRDPIYFRPVKLLNIERLLWIAEAYILNAEEAHASPRSILPHGTSFQGQQINLYITCESPKQEFMLLSHSNEMLGLVKLKIACRLRQSVDNIQIVANEKLLNSNKDQKLLHLLDFEDSQMLQVRISSSSGGIPNNQVKEVQECFRFDQPLLASPSNKQSFDLEQEKMLPGVIMAIGGQVFDMLYQLAELEEPKITSRVRKLLMLIPTDPAISDAFDSIGQKLDSKQSSSSDDVSPRSSPKKVSSSSSSSSSSSCSPQCSASKQSPQEILKSLLDSTGPEMSTFRLLYNLEVLSSKLMPTGEEVGVQHSARRFCDDFLLAGGLGLVVRILQPEAISTEVCYSIRQGCYSICLQLARFLLCGQTVTGEVYPPSPQATVKAATGGAQWSVSVSVESSGGAGSKALQTMTMQDFGETVACLMRITWAAAAGRLHLMSVNQPIRESTVATGRRSRQSSTGSTGSTGSESEGQTLHAGVCAQQGNLSTKDCNIAREALEILITCLQLRSGSLSVFYSLPCVHDFIIDILVGSPHPDIRNAALEHFYQLSQTEILNSDNSVSPHKFLLSVLLKSRLPFWVTSSAIRGSSQRLLHQCSQYFELRCRLLENLSVDDQKILMVDVSTMLEDEIGWLSNFVISEYHELRPTENMLLAGHLKLCKALFTCEGIINKEEFGKDLLYELLYDFLFPASKLIMDNQNEARNDEFLNFNPKCSSTESRVAAYDLLTELANKCLTNLEHICKHLIRMHHLPNPECSNEWEYMPPVDGRAECGFVGLKNGGATCYMNSVLQQIFMVPGISEFILSIDEDNPDEESVFYQVQHIFGHLTDSKLQYHEPESFWKVFKLWGQTINVHEQQDAFDFFQALIDQMDEQMKNLGREEVFKKKFQGIFSDQKICKDCPHRYEREEPFFALNLTVKNATLQDSLDQFVKGELLEGDNAYFCEKCREKRNTIKRMCIKTLPPLLCIQLKRFGYDWEAQKALKFDDYFKFPWVLDMEPYTEEGMARQESESVNACLDEDSMEKLQQQREGNNSVCQLQSSEAIHVSANSASNKINYELVGIVVHSGQANAGHYYSYIKDRRGTVSSNPRKGCWFKFNDITVEEFHMTDVSLEAECFGGLYKAKVYDQSMTYPEERIRYWNGYMLYYERIDEPRTPVSAKKTKVSLSKRTHLEPSRRSLNSDSLVELTELVHKGEKRGMFTVKMPASIEQVIRAENIIFVKNRDVYNAEYFRFIKNLAACNTPQEDAAANANLCEQSLQLGMKFLFNTYFRAKLKAKAELDDWVTVIETLVSRCKAACMWLVEFMDGEQGYAFIKSFLLECPNKDVRLTMAKILERMMSSFFQHGGVATHKSFDNILGHLLQMLNKDLPDNIKNCIQYFLVLKSYVQMGTKACIHMFFRKGFNHLINFLLGTVDKEEELSSRRWIPIQARDFGHLQTTLATLVLNCDVSSYRTEDPGLYPVRLPQTVLPQLYLKMSDDMHYYVFGPGSFRYINEVVYAVREVSGNLESVTDMLLYCSFCNSNFSMTVLECLMIHYQTAPCNEVRNIFALLNELLLLKDPLQLKRLKWAVIDGHVNEKGKKFEGLLSTIRSFHLSDSSRSYQCIKFLVQLCNQCSLVKDQLMKTSSKWQWAVKWLEKKMSDYWAPSSTVPLSNEDSNQKSFQRTVSAQDTLDSATALLTEIEANDNLTIPATAVVGHRSSLKSNYTSMQSIPDDTSSRLSATPPRSQVTVSVATTAPSTSSSDKTSTSSDSGNSTSTKRAQQQQPPPPPPSSEGSSSSSSDTVSVSES